MLLGGGAPPLAGRGQALSLSSHQFPTWQRGGERGSVAYSSLCRKPDSPCAARGSCSHVPFIPEDACTIRTAPTVRPLGLETAAGPSDPLRKSGDTFAGQTPSGPKPEFDFPQQPERCPPQRPGNPAPGSEGPAAVLGVKGRERKSRGKPCSTLFSIYV